MAGRPTKYCQEIVDKARHYLENYKDYDDVVPQIAGLAVALGIHRDTIYEWAKDPQKEEFTDTLKKIEISQHKVLVNGGLSGVFTAPITKLMLANHGYSEKQEVKQDITGQHTVEHSGSVTITKEEAKQISQALDEQC